MPQSRCQVNTGMKWVMGGRRSDQMERLGTERHQNRGQQALRWIQSVGLEDRKQAECLSEKIESLESVSCPLLRFGHPS